jgi:hypothetical protein
MKPLLLKLLKRRKFLQGLGLSALSFTLLSQNTQANDKTKKPKYSLEVSSHGGAPKDPSKFKLFEKDWQLKFFVKEGEILECRPAEKIFEDIANNRLDEVDKRVKHIIFSGGDVIDYNLWDLKQNPKYISGLFEAGKREPLIDISGTTKDKPIKLKQLLEEGIKKLNIKEEDSVVVYFNACRSPAEQPPTPAEQPKPEPKPEPKPSICYSAPNHPNGPTPCTKPV